MKRFLLTLSALSLGACGSMIDHQSQEITVRTPGAENAKCDLYNQDIKYSAWTDQTIEIMKSPNDLVVSCMAAGNREKTVLVQRGINGWTIFNVANGFVPGVAYDHFSRGLYSYPHEIEVSFVGEAVKPYPEPSHLSSDLKHNNVYNRVPNVGPKEQVTEATKFKQNYELQKINRYNGSDFGSGGQAQSSPARAGGYQLDSIHRQYNPSVAYDPNEEVK